MKKYFLLFVLSLAIFLFHTTITKHAIYGDGNGYYSYTNSLYFQGNLNFDPIYNHLSNFQGKTGVFSRIFWDTSYAKNGSIRQNPYFIGTSLVWLPSMILVSIVNWLFNLNASRFDIIFELGPGIAGIFFMISGLCFLEKYLLSFFSKKAVFWTIITIYFASNIIYFTAFEPALSHEPSFFLISFLLFWTYKFKPSAKNFFILGALSGLLAIIRVADILLLIPILIHVLQSKPKIKLFLYGLVGFLLLLSPQLITQYFMYGNVWINPYLTGQNGTWQFKLFHLFEYLFSPRRGLFLWSPVFLLGMWGLIKSKSFLFLTTISILWVVTSSWSAYLSAGFGQRLSFSAIPLFSFGIANIIDRWNLRKILVMFAIFTFLNLNLLSTFYLHKDKLVQDDNLNLAEFISLQLENPIQILGYLKR